MDTNSTARFNLKSIAINGFLMIVVFICHKLFHFKGNLLHLYSLPVFGLLITFLSFIAARSKASRKNYSTLVSSLFGIKFFSYFLIVLIFFLLEKEKSPRFIFIIGVFVTYLLNTVILLASVLKYYKEENS